MNRRGFLKTAGIGAAGLAIPVWASALDRSAGKLSSEQILGQADARIEKCRKADITLKLVDPAGMPLKAGPEVRIEQKVHKFLFGCNIFKLNRCRTPEDNATYASEFAGLLNYATLPFYWWDYERQQGKPSDARTEEIVAWCKAHNVATKGHPLAWNWVDPPWLPEEPDAAMEAQYKRIAQCVSRFAGKVDIWDVVNEATQYDRPEPIRRAPKLTAAIGKMGVGPYVCGAFRAAREANPKATLVINDYRTDPAYADSVISKLVDDARGPLYDVIGIQSHMHGGYWGAERTWEVCQWFAKFGRPLHFTELTITSGPRIEQAWRTTAEGEKKQAEQVAEFYRVLFSHPAVEAITWWDFTDQNAWQGAPAGLVRSDMTPKPAYEQLLDLVRNKWWTRTGIPLADGGTAQFRGFLGQYELTIVQAGRKLTGAFRLDKTPAEPLKVQLTWSEA